MLLGVDFMPPDQISNTSLNGLRRQVTTRDKTQTKTWMDESSIELDMGHQFLASGAPPLSFHFLEKCFFRDLQD
jgi:hypothetical protein